MVPVAEPEAVMTQCDQLCPLDLEDGLARAGGEKDFYKELLDLFLEDVPQRVAELRSAIEAGDAARVASAAHSIKGAAANLSAMPVRETAYALETRGRGADLSGAPQLLAQLEAEIERLAEFVSSY